MHGFSVRFRPWSLSLLALVAVLAPFDLAPAYVLEGPRWSSGQPLPLSVQFGAPTPLGGATMTYPLLDGFSSFDQSFIQAVRLWNHYLSAGPGPVMTPTIFPAGPPATRYNNTAFFSPTDFGMGFGTNVLAITHYSYSGPLSGGTMAGADIVFNSTQRFNSYRGASHFAIYDFQRVAIHELGHFLGINHPDQAGQSVIAIMNSIISETDIMQDDDIKGINVLYNGDPPPGTPGTIGITTNLSTRLNVLTGGSQAFPGFIVKGTGTKKVLVRAIGPSLAQFGLTGLLMAPSMTLKDANGNTLATNTGWKTLPLATQNQLISAGQAPQDDAECAIVMDLPASATGTAYTALVSGVGGTTGLGRVDIIDFDPTHTAAKLTNVSTRGQVQAGSNVMIGGFIINGTLPKQMWIRAVGPSLAGFGVPGPISDPTMTIYDSNGNQVYINNDWQSAQSQMLTGHPIQPTNTKESAVIINLPPGAYTVIVSGVGGVTGNGRVDIVDGDNGP